MLYMHMHNYTCKLLYAFHFDDSLFDQLFKRIKVLSKSLIFIHLEIKYVYIQIVKLPFVSTLHTTEYQAYCSIYVCAYW